MEWKKWIPKLNNRHPEQDPSLSEAHREMELLQENDAVRGLKRRVRLQAVTALVSVAVLLVMLFAVTAAWYTNVAKTSDLMFKAEAWGFDAENIDLSAEAISVFPGSEGIVPLTVDNSANTEAVKISVTVGKSAVSSESADSEELKKRIYFYVDQPQTITFGEEEATTEETVSRVYLGATEENSYSYTILPGQTLTLSEEYYTDVPIKWMWVYDMLGYYFTGTVDTTAQTVAVSEYIRPIEYDYAYAVFDDTVEITTETDTTTSTETTVTSPGPMYGQLLSTGELSRNAFIESLTAADGYEGTITEAALNAENAAIPVRIPGVAVEGSLAQDHLYYPVAVDETGTGVWLYLCNKEEIQAAIAFDSSLPEQDSVSLLATVVFTAVNIPAETVAATSAEELTAALQDAEIDVVTLNGDIRLAEELSLTGEISKVIDLNDYTLNSGGISVADGASLTVMNGSLVANGTNTAFDTDDGELVLSGVTATGFARLVENDGASTIRISGCTAETTNVSVMLRGSGLDADTTAKLIIEDSTLASNYITVCGNGNPESAGTEIVIRGSTLSGTYGALYQPQQRANTVITDSILTGWTGIAVKGGAVTVIDSKINGTGAYTPAANASSGYTDTGDGVYVEAGYNCSASVLIKGENTVVSSTYGYAVQLFGVEGMGPGKIVIYDGNFTVGTTAKGSYLWNEIGTFDIRGGTYSTAVATESE